MGSDPQGLTPTRMPWFGPCGASLRPGRTSCRPPRAAAVKDGRLFGARPQGLSLTDASTAARLRGTGRSNGTEKAPAHLARHLTHNSPVCTLWKTRNKNCTYHQIAFTYCRSTVTQLSDRPI